ncbi:M56 family metallopeptidase [Verrucomicrobium sp. BvORR034]|uniref:M56 family metallopeptidase n=1 Tax=Verrucomicrobium sp. BvORR034 TaxID=1396418 RepID=UPI000679E7C6|nr:M56 family metallopeptidase [Verrucomicrobium sp. BvORR034]
MSLLLSYWVLVQELYPALTMALLAAFKVAAIYLLASLLSSWGRSRSALFRSWLWRATFCGWLVTLVWVVAPSSLGRLGELVTLTGEERELPQDVQSYLEHSPKTGSQAWELAPQGSRQVFLTAPSKAELPPWVHPADHEVSRFRMQKPLFRDLEQWLIPAWMGGAILILGGRLVRAASGLAWLHRSSLTADELIVNLVAKEARNLQMSHVPVCRMVPDLSTPLLTSATGATIWLPSSFAAWPQATVRFAVQHELAHLQRRDGLWQWIGLLTAAAWWWHPLAWRAFAALKLEAEYAADELVSRQADRGPDYAEALLEIARAVPSSKRQVAGVAMVSESAVGDRIKIILTESTWKGRLNFGGKCCSLLLLVAAMALASMSVQSASGLSRSSKPLDKGDAQLVREALSNLLAKHERLRRIKVEAEFKENIGWPSGVAYNTPKNMPSVLLTGVKIDMDTWTEARTQQERYLVEGRAEDGRPLAAEWVEKNPHYPTGMKIDLGFRHEYELMRILKVLLEAGRPNGRGTTPYVIQQGTRKGNRTLELTVMRYRKSPISLQSYTQYVVDIDRGLLREVRTVEGDRRNEEPNLLWELVEPLESPEGIWYPRRYRVQNRWNVQEVAIKEFEVAATP